MTESIAQFFVQIVSDWGYIGIFLLMTLESTVFPIPSELVMIPAGYLAHQGELSATLSVISGTVGSLVGAMINYIVSRRYGRSFLWNHGKKILVSRRRLAQMDYFFRRYGEITTFLGRLIPVARHYISIPAGLAKMRLWRFMLFTSLGAFVWMVVLTALGYFIGNNIDEIKEYTHLVGYTAIALAIMAFAYYYTKKRVKIAKN
jgi:membrane protein DedA with SNARE-associated domain